MVVAGVAAVLTATVLAGQLAVHVEVEGMSMAPTLVPGDRLVVLARIPVRRGRIVALHDPREPDRLLVKRVHAVTGGRLDVRGDDPTQSTDSRHFGTVERRDVVGTVVWRYAPGPRAGRVRRPAGPADPTGELRDADR